LIVWLEWLFLCPLYSVKKKETKGGVSGIFVVFFIIHRAVRVSGKKFVGLYYFVSVLYGSVYGKSTFIFGGAYAC